MAKSRLALPLLLGLGLAAAPASPAAAQQTVTAEEALANARRTFAPTAEIDCPRAQDADEIVVCARQGPDPYRLPLASPPAPGSRVRGEAPSATEAMTAADDPCTTVGPNQRCSGGLPVLGIAMFLAKAAIKAVKGDD